MNFSKVNKKDLISDLVKVATFNIVAHVLMGVTYNEPVLSEKFVYSLIFTLLGFALYHVFIHIPLMNFVRQCEGPRASSSSAKSTSAKRSPSAKLSSAKLSSAKLSSAKLSSAKLSSAKLSSAKLSSAKSS